MRKTGNREPRITKLVSYLLAGVGYAVACIAVSPCCRAAVAGGPGNAGVPGRQREPRRAGCRDRVGWAVRGNGAGLGALLGGEVITIAGLLLYLYVAEPLISHITALGPLAAYLPGVAADGLTQASQAGVRLLAPWQGGLVFAARAAAGTAAASRRDIT